MFFVSLFLILFLSIIISFLFTKLKLPPLIGFILIGILLGPYCLDLIDINILNISSELRKIALILILIRAGLSLNLQDLKKIGYPAVLMSFVPAIFEIIAVGLFAPLLFDISYLDAFILGSVLGAVSPAVVVPRMIEMIDKKQGTNNSLPQLVIAGSSIDDVVVIVIFTALTTVAMGNQVSVLTFLNVPSAIILGIITGLFMGFLLVKMFKKIHMRDTIKVIIICGISFGFYGMEILLSPFIGFSGLLASMTLGISILWKYAVLAKRLANKYAKLWVVSEIILFVLLGASVDINYFFTNFFFGIILMAFSLLIRSLGVLVSLTNTPFNKKEKCFIMVSYLPKATVQAAIGGLPLSMGLPSGALILSIAVIYILITAPIGAFGIDHLKYKLLGVPLS
ncbi:MAG: cation:proton antiporter [Bacilli bacterium]